MELESLMRSMVKAISYRIAGTFSTALIVYTATGALKLAVEVGALEAVSKVMLYYIHERIWDRLPWGRLSRREVR